MAGGPGGSGGTAGGPGGPGGPDEAKYEVRNHSVTTRGHPSPQRTHLNGKNQSL